MLECVRQGLQWYLASLGSNDAAVCISRDIFQARLDSMYRSLLKNDRDANEAALLTAIIGEVGNNCFDHNLGQWHDIGGCWFHYASEQGDWIVIADRGQGILSSLQSVVPALDSHQAALDVAFRTQISGRAPEQRGNGLKFVRSVINGNVQRGLLCLSGNGRIGFGGLARVLESNIDALQPHSAGQGTFFLVRWSSL